MIGIMTNNTDREKKSGSTAPHSMVITRMVGSTDMASSHGLMVPRMLATLRMVPSVAKVNIPGQMEENMTVSGSKERCTDLVSSRGKTAKNTKAISTRTNSMATV